MWKKQGNSLVGKDSQAGAPAAVMVYNGMVGSPPTVLEYCKSYNVNVTSSMLMSAYISLVGAGPGTSYLDVYIIANGKTIGVNYQNISNATGGVSTSTSATEMLLAGPNTVLLCVHLTPNLTSANATFAVSWIN